jgi:hypothetical protein
VKTKEEENLTKTLDECINLFLEKEFLEGEDQQIYCSKCRCLTNFYKKYDFDRLPPYLILSLKRFKFAKMYKKKIDNLITFPLFDLELKSNNLKKNNKYDLCAVINHSGILSAGHYTANVKINSKWIKCDDSNCFELDESSIVTSGAYILVYKLKDESTCDGLNNCEGAEKIHNISSNNITTNYFKMTNYILNILDIQVNSILKNEKIENLFEKVFVIGEPVKSLYGRGFVKDEGYYDGVRRVKVKYRHGYGVLR